MPGIEVLKDADLLVMDIRRKSLPKEQLDLIREYLNAGKPFVGFRQASHAFEVGDVPEGGAVWPTFDIEVLGCDYRGHGRKGTKVTIDSKNAEHPILRGVTTEPWVSESPIYAEGTEEKDAVVLWWGHQKDRTEAVAWTRLYKAKGRIFYTSLGVPENIEQPQFRRLAINGMLWALNEPITK